MHSPDYNELSWRNLYVRNINDMRQIMMVFNFLADLIYVGLLHDIGEKILVIFMTV